MPHARYVIVPQQTLVTETSEAISRDGIFPIEWAIKLSIGKNFLAELSCRDVRVRAYVSFGLHRYYWNVVGRRGDRFDVIEDGYTDSAEDALQRATDATYRARVVVDERERADALMGAIPV